MEWDFAARDGDDLSAASCFVTDPAVSVLLDGDHVIQTDADCLNYKAHNPFWISSPTLRRTSSICCSKTAYPHWLMTTMRGRSAPPSSPLFSIPGRLSIERLRFKAARMSGLEFISRIWSRRRLSFRCAPSWFSSDCSTAPWR